MTRARSGLIFCCVLLGFSCPGCRKPPIARPTNPPASASEEFLGSARDFLARRTDLVSCRSALRQLNAHWNSHPEQKPTPLDERARALLQEAYGIDAGELSEINSTTFTLLDAHHLELCFLLRDAARSLDLDGLPAPEQAAQAFAWVVRQVRLQESSGEPLPPAFVLRRGSGSDLERSLVFLALLRQFGIDGCLVACPRDNGGPRRLAGALIGTDIYLFDSALGLPLPGGKEKPATLAQVRAQADLLEPLAVGPHPYDLKTEQFRNATLELACPLSALAPRMRSLEEMLGFRNKISVFIDGSVLVAKLREGARVLDLKVQAPTPADPHAPVRLLRRFLPPEEGGSDTLHAVPLRALPGFAPGEEDLELPLFRAQFFDYARVPWAALPPEVRQLPWNVQLGRLPREGFKNIVLNISAKPRELLQRGQLEQALTMLVANRDQVNEHKKVRRLEPKLLEQVRQWCATAREAQAEVLQARTRAARTKGPDAEAELQAAQARLKQLWESPGNPLPLLLLEGAASAVEAELTYALALCKHEQAERLQSRLERPGTARTPAETATARQAWLAAAEWWWAFANEYHATPPAAAARTLQARALAALGDTAAARGLLENLSGQLTPLEKTARLYQARQLKQ